MRPKLHSFHIRVDPDQLAGIRRLADELRIPDADLLRQLISEGMARQQNVPGSPAGRIGDHELDLHLLVAIEQVLALIESFLPQGPGAAHKVLPEAVHAAQRRLEIEAGEE
jgi:hypothetical protein